jgi:DNA repair protein RecO (recombination protein O)
MSLHRSSSLVLRKYDFSETSQVLHLFGREPGKVKVLAKGIKRKNRSFEGVPDMLDVGSACWIERRSRQGLGILTEWRQERNFIRIRGNLEAHYSGLYLAELLDGLTEEQDPHPALFDGLIDALDRIDAAAARPAAVLRFEVLLLRESGYAPGFDECTQCGRPPAPGTDVYYSSGSGGIVCRDCEFHLVEKRRLNPAVAALLRQFVAEAAEIPVAPPSVWTEAADLMRYHFQHLLGRELKTARFLADAAARRAEST